MRNADATLDQHLPSPNSGTNKKAITRSVMACRTERLEVDLQREFGLAWRTQSVNAGADADTVNKVVRRSCAVDAASTSVQEAGQHAGWKVEISKVQKVVEANRWANGDPLSKFMRPAQSHVKGPQPRHIDLIGRSKGNRRRDCAQRIRWQVIWIGVTQRVANAQLAGRKEATADQGLTRRG